MNNNILVSLYGLIFVILTIVYFYCSKYQSKYKTLKPENQLSKIMVKSHQDLVIHNINTYQINDICNIVEKEFRNASPEKRILLHSNFYKFIFREIDARKVYQLLEELKKMRVSLSISLAQSLFQRFNEDIKLLEYPLNDKSKECIKRYIVIADFLEQNMPRYITNLYQHELGMNNSNFAYYFQTIKRNIINTFSQSNEITEIFDSLYREVNSFKPNVLSVIGIHSGEEII